jgi:hypothetical protein
MENKKKPQTQTKQNEMNRKQTNRQPAACLTEYLIDERLEYGGLVDSKVGALEQVVHQRQKLRLLFKVLPEIEKNEDRWKTNFAKSDILNKSKW